MFTLWEGENGTSCNSIAFLGQLRYILQYFLVGQQSDHQRVGGAQILHTGFGVFRRISNPGDRQGWWTGPLGPKRCIGIRETRQVDFVRVDEMFDRLICMIHDLRQDIIGSQLTAASRGFSSMSEELCATRSRFHDMRLSHKRTCFSCGFPK